MCDNFYKDCFESLNINPSDVPGDLYSFYTDIFDKEKFCIRTCKHHGHPFPIYNIKNNNKLKVICKYCGKIYYKK